MPGDSDARDAAAAALLGRWLKAAGLRCADQYPDRLEFLPPGIYRGAKETAQAFTVWDAGSWHVLDARHVRLSTANDAEIIYEFALEGHRLAFVDPDGCAFEYVRETVG